MFHPAMLGPALALVSNAFVWGLSWWPLRQLDERGLHPLWTTAIVFGVSVAIITLWRPRAWRQLAAAPALWLLVAAAGSTNAAFNWGVTIGDVVRVVLLFYLMPLWAVLLARVLLHERLTRLAFGRVALAIAGAAVVLWPADGSGLPWPREAADWLGLAGGFCFALNNVLLRRLRHQPAEARTLAMFVGGLLVAGTLAMTLGGGIARPPAADAGWLAIALALGTVYIGSNVALQYGVARLPANVTAVIMLTEVVFASVSSVLLGGGRFGPRLAAGGLLIVSAALLAALEPRPAH